MGVSGGPALAERDALFTETWSALGTTALLRSMGSGDPRRRAAVEAELQAIDAAASRFSDRSELSRLNAAAARGAGAVVVSPLLHEAVTLAVRAARVTGGAVDPTLGERLISVGYDRDWRELAGVAADAPLTPADRIVVHTRRHGAWEGIELGDDPPSVRLPAGISLDLGATAKALAADRCAAAAAAAADDGVGVLVSLGGDIATAGPAPAGGWRIHVTDDHRASPDAPGQTVSIESGGLATSSIVTRRWTHAGRTMHHILDPGSGEPVQSRWRTASVAAATCADANIASTAAIVLGDDAPDWLAEQGLPARLVTVDGSVHIQGGWPA